MIRNISAMLLRNWHRNNSELNASGNKNLIHIVNNRLHNLISWITITCISRYSVCV